MGVLVGVGLRIVGGTRRRGRKSRRGRQHKRWRLSEARPLRRLPPACSRRARIVPFTVAPTTGVPMMRVAVDEHLKPGHDPPVVVQLGDFAVQRQVAHPPARICDRAGLHEATLPEGVLIDVALERVAHERQAQVFHRGLDRVEPVAGQGARRQMPRPSAAGRPRGPAEAWRALLLPAGCVALAITQQPGGQALQPVATGRGL